MTPPLRKGIALTYVQSGKGVRWNVVVAELVNGNIDEFTTVLKTPSAATTKSTLLKKYPGLGVDLKSLGDRSQITLKLGAYEER